MALPASTRLLVAHLRPLRGRVSVLAVVLVVSMSLPLLGPTLIGRFIDAAIDEKPLRTLLVLAGLYTANAVVSEALQLLVTWQTEKVSWLAGNRMREDLAAQVLRLDMSWHGRHSPGELIERIDGDVEHVWGYFTQFVLQVLGNAVLLVGVLVAVMAIDVRVGLALLLFAFGSGGLLVALRRAAVPSAAEERAAGARLYGDLEERLGGLDDLRANGAAAHVMHRFWSLATRHRRSTVAATSRGAGAYALTMTLFGLGAALVLGLGVGLHAAGSITAGTVFALFRYTQMVRSPLEHIAERLRDLQKALAGAERAAALLATEPTLVEGAGVELPPGPLAVDLDAVTFAYDDGRAALRDIEIHLEPGSVLGVVGRTGSGKTSLGRIVLRLFDVQHGSVRIGGVDVRDIDSTSLRRRVAVVTQDVQLFQAAVRDNLTLFGAVPATDDQLLATLHALSLGPWLARLPDGLDSILQGATSLSAGEAQLLAFARAFLVDPGVLLLDEASSRLDPDSEARIDGATAHLLAGRTAIVIAHRLQTLARADSIVVLDHGRIVEQGTRHALALDPTSRFASLLRLAETAGGDVEGQEVSA